MSILFETLAVLDTAVRFLKLARETRENSFSISLKAYEYELIDSIARRSGSIRKFSLCFRGIRKHQSILHNNC